MLIALMYHQVYSPDDNSFDFFVRHLGYLKDNFHLVAPGEKLKKGINICLTFDDAYYDFYHYVFPLLRKFNIPAVLGIPTDYIKNDSTLDYKDRLSVKYPSGLNESFSDPLCSWKEIKEMVRSGYVYPASHSMRHTDLSTCSNLVDEIVKSKELLVNKLGQSVDSFIFPYGKTSAQAIKLAREHYSFVMRIGGAINYNWQQKILYRIDADHFWKNDLIFTKKDIWKWALKYYLNKLRSK